MATPTKSGLFDPDLKAETAISQSPQPAQLNIGFVPKPQDGTQLDFQIIRKAYDDLPGLLENWEAVIVELTANKLVEHEKTPNSDNDSIFAFHTDFVSFCVNARIANRARLLWERKIAPLVAQSEARLRTANPAARIHKGAPLYNVGLCCFVLGDFDNAYRFLAEAGIEDEKSGRGSRFKIVLGDHSLSEQVLITPLEKMVFPLWSTSYAAVTNHNLDKAEFVSLLAGLARRPADAFQTMIALHRFRRSLIGIENEATHHIRARAIAEMVVVLESTLKRQFHPTGKMLNDLLEQVLGANPKAEAAFKAFKAAFKASPHGNANPSVASTNWVITNGLSRTVTAVSPAERIGNVCYLMRWLRNALMHEVDSQLDLYRNRKTAEDVAGLVLCALRIAKHSEDKTLAAIP